jgi:hypothetical protein
MPVVINEFEVIPREPAPAAQSTTPSQLEQGSPVLPSPHDVAQMLTKQIERLERVRAY